MPRIAESDYRRMLDVLREAGDVEAGAPFPEPVLVALRRLVPCDVVAYHEQLDRDGEAEIVWTGEPLGPMTSEIREAHRRYWSESPLTPAYGTRKYSDFLSRREFHRLGLYQEVSRPLGVEYMIRLWLDPRGAAMARLEFDRGGRDFRERDRVVLDLLLPHLEQFRRKAAARRRAAAQSVNGAGANLITPRELEVLKLVAEGYTNAEVAQLLWISSGTIRKHLENAFEKLGVHTRTAAVVALFGHEQKASFRRQ